MKNKVTIAIPTFNAEEFLESLLEAILSQKTNREIEVITIDSGSNDRTLEILKKYPSVKLHQIPNSEFGHGRTRNLAAELAGGEYILFLTQDAIPSHDGWLEAMVEPFELSERIGCVVGKQIPLPNAPVTIKREITSVFKGLGPDDSVTVHRKNKLTEKLNLVNTFLSNTNSAVSRKAFKEIPFRDVNYAEDQALAIDMLEAGYYKAYSPLGSVNHSHNYGVREYFHRKFDEYVGLRKTTGYKAVAGARELILGSAKATFKDWAFVFSDRNYSLGGKLTNFFKAPFYNLGLRLAIRTAGNKKLSSTMHDKLSLESKLRRKNQNQ